MNQPGRLALLGTLGLLGLSGMAQATVTMVANQATFDAAVASAGIDDLDSIALGASVALTVRSAGAYTYSVGSSPSTLYGIAAAGGDRWLSTNSALASLTFSALPTGISGFGGNLFATANDGSALAGAVIDIMVFDSANVSTSFQINSGASTSFVGFLSDTGVSAVTFTTSANATFNGGQVYATANNVRMGVSPIPEPGTYGLMLGGLALLGAVVRRRSA